MNLYIPTPDIHQRHFDTGLTRFSLSEIEAAAADVQAAEAEYVAAIDRTAPILAHYDVIWGDRVITPESEAVIAAVESFSEDTRGRDMFPVTKWVALAKRYRRAAVKIHKAVDAWERREDESAATAETEPTTAA